MKNDSISPQPMPIIRQTMILSAGKGTRMRPLTLTTPKPLVRVGDKPLIVWHILALKKIGITHIVINVGWLGEKLVQALGDGSDFGVKLLWSREDLLFPQENEATAEPLETAGGIKYALGQELLRDEPFILINGDVWTDYNLANLTQIQLNDKRLAHLLLTDKAEHNPIGDFALSKNLVQLDGEKKYTFAGLSVLSPRLFDSVKMGETKALAPILKQAIAKQKVTGELITADWVDVGTLERLEALNKKLATFGEVKL